MVRRRRQLVAVASRYLDWIIRLGGNQSRRVFFCLGWAGVLGSFKEVWGGLGSFGVDFGGGWCTLSYCGCGAGRF